MIFILASPILENDRKSPPTLPTPLGTYSSNESSGRDRTQGRRQLNLYFAVAAGPPICLRPIFKCGASVNIVVHFKLALKDASALGGRKVRLLRQYLLRQLGQDSAYQFARPFRNRKYVQRGHRTSPTTPRMAGHLLAVPVIMSLLPIFIPILP